MRAFSWRVLVFVAFGIMGVLLLARGAEEAVSDKTYGVARASASDASALETSPEARASYLAETTSKYIKIDIKTARWMWWPLLVYLFWGMAYVCDDYFVRTIEVISERFSIPDDVAGATLMALGCNGPEMALNTIAIFNPSDIGVGAVIGGEVFNVLVIIGTAMLATPDMYLPLRISNFSFFRDVIFYCASVLMLYLILKDGYISRAESLTLIGGAVCYSTFVALSSKIRHGYYVAYRKIMAKFEKHDTRVSTRVSKRCPTLIQQGMSKKDLNRATLARSRSIYEVVNGPRKSCLANGQSPESGINTDFDYDSDEDPANDSDFENEADEELVKAWGAAKNSVEPDIGSVVAVRVEVRSRMMDRSNRADERYMWLTPNSLMVSAAVSPTLPQEQKGRAGGMVFCTKNHMWHYGGLVNVPDIIDGERLESPRSTRALTDQDSKKVALLRTVSRVPDRAGILGLNEVPVEEIPLKNVLYCDPVKDNPNMFTLHVHQEDDLGLGRLITLEMICKNGQVHDAWVSSLRENLMHASNRRLDSRPDEKPADEGILAGVKAWCEWFQFPVVWLAKKTIPDMDDPSKQHWYPVAFTMSMAWLALFAYGVVAACDGLHADFGIPTGILGFTIAAAGTSFPNVFSGMVVSRQGKTTMALANALGANVQNVFLALAIPWTIQSCFINHGPFPMDVVGLESQIVSIYVTLCPVVFIFIFSGFKLPGWTGYVLLITYVLYLIVALEQQSTGCMTWPIIMCN